MTSPSKSSYSPYKAESEKKDIIILDQKKEIFELKQRNNDLSLNPTVSEMEYKVLRLNQDKDLLEKQLASLKKPNEYTMLLSNKLEEQDIQLIKLKKHSRKVSHSMTHSETVLSWKTINQSDLSALNLKKGLAH
jgi:hypothetical protein